MLELPLRRSMRIFFLNSNNKLGTVTTVIFVSFAPSNLTVEFLNNRKLTQTAQNFMSRSRSSIVEKLTK